MVILDDIDRSIQNYMLTLLLANVLLALFSWVTFRWFGLANAGAWAVAAGRPFRRTRRSEKTRIAQGPEVLGQAVEQRVRAFRKRVRERHRWSWKIRYE